MTPAPVDSRSAKERFTDRVADDVRYRPYPPALLDWIHGELGVARDACVADIGAGTGISSALPQAGHPVIAVEPNAAMRAAAWQALGATPGFTVVDGDAAHSPLASASTSTSTSTAMVTAAQAFHWFDMEATRREWARILVPGGLAVVFWNSRLLDSSPFMHDDEQLLLTYGTDDSAVAERYQDAATMQAWFGSGFRATIRLPNVQRLDFDALRGRLLSSSYAPLPGHPAHAPMLEALQRLFMRHRRDGVVSFDHQPRAFAGTLN